MTRLDYNRKTIADTYHVIEILDCPIEIILFAADRVSKNLTIENAQSYNRQETVRMTLEVGDITISPTLLKYHVDFMLTKEQFIALSTYWDKQGCYAVFHDTDTLKFKATDLDDRSRYRVLDNFGWTLELAIPGPASSGWGQITSPSSALIDEIETQIKNYR
jgi:hypothetical protein